MQNITLETTVTQSLLFSWLGNWSDLFQIEIQPLKTMLLNMIEGIKFAYVIVSKRINTRYVLKYSGA